MLSRADKAISGQWQTDLQMNEFVACYPFHTRLKKRIVQ
jgi:hypothetical protein